MNTMEKQQTFSEIIKSEKLVLVDFFAEWCGPCKMMKPILEEVKAKAAEKIRILKVDVDRNQLVSSSFGIQGVPTLILFKNGNPVWRQSGVVGAEMLLQLIRQHQE
ncbi:MAG: thioredoxin [Bacteroidia bacterium]|nr:thioredoxin [Bacteroidia bacterium]MCZ2278494.1 thioredoxin [Bacteroidia bacterium]